MLSYIHIVLYSTAVTVLMYSRMSALPIEKAETSFTVLYGTIWPWQHCAIKLKCVPASRNEKLFNGIFTDAFRQAQLNNG